MQWDHSKFLKDTTKKAMDGTERCVLTVMKPQALMDCPVAPIKGGTLRGSIGTSRDDSELKVYLGAGGAAQEYAAIIEKDRSLNHTTGKAGFLRDSVQMHMKSVSKFVQEDINK